VSELEREVAANLREVLKDRFDGNVAMASRRLGRPPTGLGRKIAEDRPPTEITLRDIDEICRKLGIPRERLLEPSAGGPGATDGGAVAPARRSPAD